METSVIKFKLPLLESLAFIEALVSIGYRATGNKFHVEFGGSKGYLSYVLITCEGIQPTWDNRIWIEHLRTKDRRLRSRMVEVFHSHANGLRVVVQGEPQPEPPTPAPVSAAGVADDDYQDLPF